MASKDNFTSTVDGAAAYEQYHGEADYDYWDDHEEPDLVGSTPGGRVFGPNDHTCQEPKLKGLTCHVCQREGKYDHIVSWEERQRAAGVTP